MKKFFGVVLILIASACSSKTTNSANQNDEKSSVQVKNANPGVGEAYVLGDSLANGVGASDVKLKPVHCLETFYHQTVFDLSVPGKTSADVLSEQVPQLSTTHPRLVFVSSGGNDTMIDFYSHTYPASKSLKEMATVFQLLLDSHAVVAYLSLDPGRTGAERLPEIAQLAASMGVIVIDGMQGFWNDPSMMSPDQIHPNDKGYAIMCDRITAALAPYYP